MPSLTLCPDSVFSITTSIPIRTSDEKVGGYRQWKDSGKNRQTFNLTYTLLSVSEAQVIFDLFEEVITLEPFSMNFPNSEIPIGNYLFIKDSFSANLLTTNNISVSFLLELQS